jgi:DNA topoisomerase-1
MNLVIVESPAKAKTIEGYLGKDYVVKSSYGHVRDLAKKGLSIDVEKGFKPDYEVMADKKKVITELKSLVKKSDTVWLATDEDREGEAISWHLADVLKLDQGKTKRIVFNEITKPAITRAIENPRTINMNLVNAQQARRVLDRIVGFELSPVLWKKVRPSLSAGRVQSVTVRLIVEREREIQAFKAESAFRIVAEFKDATGRKLKAELNKRYKTEEEAMAFVNGCASASFSVEALTKKPAKRTPAAPFTTSTLQQEASRKLGFSVTQTMVVAQRLYESGKITYMRTDSTNLSDTAINSSKEVIPAMFGQEYLKNRRYSKKSKGAQEAHEAIRPTNLDVREVGGERNEQRLYDLIWKRTLATQMADAELERTTLTIGVSNADAKFIAKGEVIKFDGFLKLYVEGTDDDLEDAEESGIIPPLNKGEELSLEILNATERFSNHPPRYTEASLVKKLEELGIGRPSTYAPTITTIQKRGYVEKKEPEGNSRDYRVIELENGQVKAETKTEITGRERNKLSPTDIGVVVNDFLIDHFDSILDYNFTATVEKDFDEIAQGQLVWNKMIETFYGSFHKNVEHTLETSERATGERALGTDPDSGRPIIVRIGKFGPMVQIGTTEDEEKPKFASLRKDQSIQDITLEEALDLFKLPRDLGEFEGQKVSAAIGRFGPYIRHGNAFVSIPKDTGDDVMTIGAERAIELIEEKRKADAAKIIKQFDENKDVQILRGRYGPYIKFGKQNVKIPKDKEPETLTLEECLELAESAPKKKSRSKRK